MKVLFSTAHFGFLRNFEAALRHLAQRGHEIVLTSDRGEDLGGETIVERLRRDFPDIRVGKAPKSKGHRWYALQRALRLSLDYLRYLDPRFDEAPKLRERAAGQAPAWMVRLTSLPLVRSRLGIGMLRRTLRALERSLPVNPAVEDFLREQEPDVLLITPLLYFGSNQVDLVRAARAQGIRSVLGVGSWDHLTTKGLIHEVPDRLIVWNRAQQQEAAELHGIPERRVVVTGAQAYDHWFDRGPSRDREAFCDQIGLRPDRPFFLYVCSSIFIAPEEHLFIGRWLERVRADDDPALRNAGLLIRPHPQNAGHLDNLDLAAHRNVTIFPRAGANPIDAESRDDYFDSMFHSRAVVGLNTSAMIEAGIVGRPVFTVLDHEFSGTQSGTLHFQHLMSVSGGLVHSATDLDEHARQLAGELETDRGDAASKSRSFVEAFIRPHGFDSPPGRAFADALEEFAREPTEPYAGAPRWAPLLRPLTYPLAMAAERALQARKRKRA